ncbi:MAG TPA: DegT/DnrJ/EryC1/StrS family aminotransferase, partial [Chloroflexota bacterium]|nr:DegT/DnrJ/EryC1/StrS family aminotransferase [Chloroflexota bacterium]
MNAVRLREVAEAKADLELAINGGKPLIEAGRLSAPNAGWRPGAAERVRRLVESNRTFKWFGGPLQEEFETRFAAWVGANHAVMCSSGTVALALVLEAAGVTRGSVVGVPSFAFYSVPNVVVAAGAIPFVLRISPVTHQVDLDAAVDELPRGAFLLAVHTLGRAFDVAEFARRRPDVVILEDAAEAQTTKLHGAHVGNVGVAACWSLTTDHNVVHAASTGGVVTTDDSQFAVAIRRLAHYGKPSRRLSPHYGVNPVPLHLGFNGMTSEIEACVALATLSSADEEWRKRRYLGSCLEAAMASLGFQVPQAPLECDQNYYDVTFYIPDSWADYREWAFEALIAEGCPAWTYHSYLSLQWFQEWMISRDLWDSRVQDIARVDAPKANSLLAIRPPHADEDVPLLKGSVAKVLMTADD